MIKRSLMAGKAFYIISGVISGPIGITRLFLKGSAKYAVFEILFIN
jgi:hypothetical protein